VVKQYTENQYDDDLTVGNEDYDDSYYTGSVDLFEFANDEESPISRLKSLILSIDWEITDEVLMQFNEELVDLREIWAGEKINLVYIQALEKISKYIYQKKADSHPSAIKLLLTLYHNLEKIVSSFDLTEEQKKQILLEDVKRFESLKRYIGQQAPTEKTIPTEKKSQKISEKAGDKKDLLNLKAIVLGIDWEITDQDLNELRQEVVRLEEKFAESRPRLILLQGIGTLGAYIKLKKSDAHADAFKILHLFYESLEKIVTAEMTLEEEKAVLFPAVEKFNSFKTLLGPTISAESISKKESGTDDESPPEDSAAIAPAFADLPEQEIKGFQAEEEAVALGLVSSDSVDDHVENFFFGSSGEQPKASDLSEGLESTDEVLPEVALQGVEVELDDEDEADEVSAGREEFAPAGDIATDEKGENELAEIIETEEPAEEDGFELPAGNFEDTADDSDEEESTGLDFSKLDKDLVLQGVDVETEADDDSDEEALPMMEGELAPALAESDEVSIYNEEIVENTAADETDEEEIFGTLGGFFDEEIKSQVIAEPNEGEIFEDTAVGPEDDVQASAPSDELTPAIDAEKPAVTEQDDAAEFEDEATTFSESEFDLPVDEDLEDFMPEAESEDADEAIAFVSELEKDESLDSLFDDSDFEQLTEEDLDEDDSAEASEAALPEGEDEPLFAQTEVLKEDNITVSEDIEAPVPDEIEEEVVFELAEEEENTADIADDLSDTEEKSPDGTSVADDTIIQASPDMEEDQEITEASSQNFPAPHTTEPGADTFGTLQTCVDSLGIEIDDKVIRGLWDEIDHLRRHLTDKPLEKTYMQLLATVVRHIDQNRYDSNDEAYGLLQSICGALMTRREDALQQYQERLFSETNKVLAWQEQLLAEQVESNEAALTIGESSQSTVDDTLADEPVQAEFEQPTGEDQSKERLAHEDDTKVLTDDLKKEISTLRQTLQDEIAELRKELKGNYP